MTILDAHFEEDKVINRINWKEREQEAYQEETPVMQQIKALKQPVKREFTKQERVNILETYRLTKHKTNTIKRYDITRAELEEVIKHGI